MIEGMKAALDYYTSTFGPYQFRQLRIVEIPPYAITRPRDRHDDRASRSRTSSPA